MKSPKEHEKLYIEALKKEVWYGMIALENMMRSSMFVRTYHTPRILVARKRRSLMVRRWNRSCKKELYYIGECKTPTINRGN